MRDCFYYKLWAFYNLFYCFPSSVSLCSTPSPGRRQPPQSQIAVTEGVINDKFIFNLKNPFKVIFFEWIFIKSFTQFFSKNCVVLGRSPKVLFFVFFVCFCNARCVYTVFNSHLVCLAYYGIKLSIRLFVFYISVE